MKNWENEPATERQKARIAWWSNRINRAVPEFHTKGQAGFIIDGMIESHPELQEEWFKSQEHIQSQREEVSRIVEKYRGQYNCAYVSPDIIDEVVSNVGLRHSSHVVDKYAENFFAAMATAHPELFTKHASPPKLPAQNVPRVSPPTVPSKPPSHPGDWICTQCSYIGHPIRIAPGSGWVEIVIWLFVIAQAFSFDRPSLLFAGILYTVWRASCKQRACPMCESRAVIPAESPKGLQIADVYKNFADNSDMRWIISVVSAIIIVVIIVIASVYFGRK